MGDIREGEEEAELLDLRSSSDEALFIAAGTPEASPSEEE